MHSEAERAARHVRLADDAVLLGPAPATESYLAVDRIVEAARRSGVAAVLPVPPALAGNARLAAAVADGRADLGRSGRRGAGAARWRRRGAGQRARLPGLGRPPTGLQFTTAVLPRPRRRHRPRLLDAAGRPPDRCRRPPGGWPRSAGAGWSPWASTPDGELAEVAAGFSLDMAVLERAHGVDAVELALRSAAGGRRGAGRRDAAARGRRRPAARHAAARARRAGSPAGCPASPARSGRRPAASRSSR